VHTKNNTNIVLLTLLKTALLAALAFSIVQPVPARAQAGSAMDLINAVNAYRASKGLEAYAIDGELMSLAQGQSEYQASILTGTHSRADGSGPGDHGISAENIAYGPNLSPQGAIAQWTDELHMATMLGPTTGLVGAGVATAGGSVYYTLAVKRLSGEFSYVSAPADNAVSAQGNSAAPAQQDPTQPSIGGIIVSTPDEDGSIAHVIKYGETLVEIANAYGISLPDLISMNKLDPKKPVYYAGQVLMIRVAFTLTPYMTTTFTPRPPTRTPLPTRTPRPTRTATPLHSPVPTRTNTSVPLVQMPTLDELGPIRPLMAYAFIGISAIGLLVLAFFAFGAEKK
jgi:uncharacterized protein YkwD